MSAVAQVIDDIYKALHNNNEHIDTHIDTLKKALAAEGKNSAEFDPARLAQPNRQGRKMLQAYFKKRGVVATFTQ
ncbi:MAG: hypothetical protein AB7L92_00820 [Alphaproteobacteria bacterium]